MAFRSDPNQMGSSRRGGGGAVPSMFCDTFKTHRIDNRDPRVRFEQRVVKNVKHARQSSKRLVGTPVLDYSEAAITRTVKNYTTQPRPDLKRNLRVETNSMVQSFNRRTQAEVLRLAEADRAGADEQSAITRVCELLKRVLEEAERTVWIVDQSKQKRATRCLHNDDNVDAQLQREKKETLAIRKQIKQVFAETSLISKVLMDARASLRALLKEKRKVLDVQADVYSGAVTSYPVPVREDPDCLKELSEVYQTSQRRRNTSEGFVEEVRLVLSHLRSKVEKTLKQSEVVSRAQQRELVLSKGRNRLARNGNARHLHWLEITQKCNEGPYEGKNYEKVADKPDRPLVKNYNKAKAHTQRTITRFEESQDPFHTFERTKACATDDRYMLSVAALAISSNLHDRSYDKNVNTSISRFRSTLKPERRL
eukprot:m.127008 g.127008  ORF g.127008 m.127008 type:complete len:424 (-) comp29239_c0_seq1:82-1353(-)